MFMKFLGFQDDAVLSPAPATLTEGPRALSSDQFERLSLALKQLEKEVASATEFIKKIENGDLDADYSDANPTDLANPDTLPGALVSMRAQMRRIAEEEQQRNWSAEGIAKFANILRNYSELDGLFDNILSQLVKYVGANQGYVYLLNSDSEPAFLELRACYAYNKKKFLEKRIDLGEGLAGQAFLERELVYLTEIPQDYVSITSGVGEALPRNIVIVPLMVNDNVLGILELASFSPLQPYQRDFLAKLSESIAATLANVQVAERTKRLLEETQMQAEAMRAQEEEMRQNMEELAATQEEMERRNYEVQRLLEASEAEKVKARMILDGAVDSVIQMGHDNIITYVNPAASKLWGFTPEEMVGQSVHKLTTRSNAEAHEAGMKRYQSTGEKRVLGKGREVEIQTKDGRVIPALLTLSEVKTDDSHFFVAFFKDITEQKETQKRIEVMLQQAQEAAEEMRAQEEELRQNLEEMNAIQEQLQAKEVMLKGQLEAIDSTMAQIEFNPDGTILSANDNFLHVMGYALADITGKHHSLFIDPAEVKTAAYKQFWAALRQGIAQNGEFKRINSAGDLVWLRATYTPVRDIKGNVIKVMKLALDITEEKRTALGNVSRLQGIDRSNATIEFTLDGTILSANDNFLKTVGYTLEEIQGQHHRIFVDAEYAQSDEYASFWKRLRTGEVFSGQFKRITKEGNEIWIQASYNPLFDLTGKPYSVMKIAVDITEQVEIQARVSQMLQQAQEALEEIRAQEEELRQNMEEMTAIQEQLHAKELASRAQLAAINNTMAQIEFSPEGSVLSANENFTRVMGYSMAEILGQHHRLFVSPEEVKKGAYKQFWENLRQGKAQSGEFKRINSAGDSVWLRATYTPVYDQEGKVVKVLKLALDITGEKKAAIANQSRVDAINRSSAVIEFDLNGTVLNTNTNFLQALGYEKPEEVVGQHHRQFVDDAYAQSEEYAQFWKRLRSGEVFAGQFRRVGKQGQEVWIQATYNPLFNADGDVYGVIKFATQIPAPTA